MQGAVAKPQSRLSVHNKYFKERDEDGDMSQIEFYVSRHVSSAQRIQRELANGIW